MSEGHSGGIKHLRNAAMLFALALIGFSLMLLPLLDRPLSATQPTEPAAPTQNFFYVVITNTPDLAQPAPEPTEEPASGDQQAGPPQPELIPTAYSLLVNEGTGATIPITWGDYPGPSSWPSYDIPPPAGLLPAPESQINILLLGNDYKRKQGARTDMVMLLTLNPDEGSATLTSFPRDLYVYAPGWSLMKLNTIQPRGGYELLKLTFEYNFGVRPDYYANISVDSFVLLINRLGGIYVDVPAALSDPTYVNGKFSVGPGLQFMDGPKAKWYVRSRATTGDLYRNQRQQAVLEAIFKRLMSADAIAKAPQLYNLYASYVVTDLNLNAILPLAPLARELYADTGKVRRYNLDLDQAAQTFTPIDGAYILLPDPEAVQALMREVLKP